MSLLLTAGIDIFFMNVCVTIFGSLAGMWCSTMSVGTERPRVSYVLTAKTVLVCFMLIVHDCPSPHLEKKQQWGQSVVH